MEPKGGWYPIGGRKGFTVKGSGGDAEPENKLDPVHIAILIFVLAIIGIAIYLLVRYPGILEAAKSLFMAIWDMLCSIADAFSDFIEYIKHQRSGPNR